MKVINFQMKKKNNKKSLTKEKQELYENAKTCYFVQKKIENKHVKDKIIVKLEIIVIIQGNKDRGAAHRICNLKYSRPKNIPIAFHY